jgi:hypothetical protein
MSNDTKRIVYGILVYAVAVWFVYAVALSWG